MNVFFRIFLIVIAIGIVVKAIVGDATLYKIIQGMRRNDSLHSPELQARLHDDLGYTFGVKFFFQHVVIDNVIRPVSVILASNLVGTFTPDQVTYGAVVLAVLAVPFLKSSHPFLPWIGVLLFVLRELFDGADGELARLSLVKAKSEGTYSGNADNSRSYAYYFDGYMDSIAGFIVVALSVYKGIKRRDSATGNDRGGAKEDGVELVVNGSDGDAATKSSVSSERGDEADKDEDDAYREIGARENEDIADTASLLPTHSQQDGSRAKDGGVGKNRRTQGFLRELWHRFCAPHCRVLTPHWPSKASQRNRPWTEGVITVVTFLLLTGLYHDVLNHYVRYLDEPRTRTQGGLTTVDFLQCHAFFFIYHFWAAVDPCFLIGFASVAFALDLDRCYLRFVSRCLTPIIILMYAVSWIHILSVRAWYLGE